VEPVGCPIEVKGPLAIAVVELDVEAAGDRDHELLQPAMGMAAAHAAPWHVIDVVDALDVERDVAPALDEGQIPSSILDFRQVVQPASDHRHYEPPSGTDHRFL